MVDTNRVKGRMMATTAAEYLTSMGSEIHGSTLPIAQLRGWSFREFDQDLTDPGNNVGRFCSVRPRWNFMDDLPTDANEGRPFQIIRYLGTHEDGISTYLVVHVDDPGSYGMVVPLEAISNLY